MREEEGGVLLRDTGGSANSFFLPPAARSSFVSDGWLSFSSPFCVRNVPPAAHFSQQLEKWAKEPFETDGFKASFTLKSLACYQP